MGPEKPADAEGQTPPGPPPPSAEGKAAPERKPSNEHLVTQLRDSMRRQRPWTVVSCLLILLVLAAPVVLLAWWFWPGGELPTLVVTAFDQVGVAGQTVVGRAQLEALEPVSGGLDLLGHEVIFNEIRFDAAKGKSAPAKARTQAGGVAMADWSLPEGQPRLAFTVRYVTPDRTRQTSDQARLFAWPQRTKVLVVDVAALMQAGEKVWEKDTGRRLALRPGAAEALRAAQGAKFAVAYLATGATRAVTYRQVRNWIERSAAAPGGLPDGPVLGRLSVSETAAAADLPKAVVAHLRRFDGPLVVLTGQAESAEAYRAAGARALVIGEGGVAWRAAAKEWAK